MHDALRRQDAIGDALQDARGTSHDDDLQAEVVREVNVHRRAHGLAEIVLDLREALGELAHVTVDDGQIIGFLLGFIAHEPEKTGYVHLVGIHPDFRRKGVGRKLYDSFAKACATAGCIRLKAITTPGNEVSLRFHIAQGWDVKELDDYAGPARRRVVFTKEIG